MNKSLIITILLILSAITLLATMPGYNNVIDAEVRAFRGHYIVEKGIPYVREDGKSYRLLLAPREALDSLGVVLVEGDSLYVEGALLDSGVLVTRLAPDVENGKDWSLRDYDLMYNYYDEETTIRVTPGKCIACKLCLPYCPVGAISMVKGKAVIDPIRCVECGICIDGSGKWRGCPVRAISK